MLSNLVEETATNPGNSLNVALNGPPAGRRGFVQAFGTGTPAFYFMTDGVQAECGMSTVTAGSPNVLARTTVSWNSAGTTARLNFTGAVRIYNEVPAEYMVFRGADGRLDQSALSDAKMSQLFAGSFSVPNATPFNAPFAAKGVNTLGAQPSATPSYALTAPETGIYRVAANMTFANNTSGQRLLQITVAGAIRAASRGVALTGVVDLSCGWEGPIAAGGLAQVFVTQDSGAALACGGTDQSNFTMTRL